MPTSRDPAARPAARSVSGPSWSGILGRVSVAALAFAGVGLTLRALAAPDGGGVIAAKLEYWRAHAGEYDTVFLGSSHVLRAFVPAEFDPLLSEAGYPSHSFNFGVQAVHLIEARYLLREILERGAGRTRRVFFEYQWLTPQIDPQNAFLPRTIYWHDAENTALAMGRCFTWGRELGDDFRYVESASGRWSILNLAERTLPADLRAAQEHLEHFGMELFQIGRGKDVARGLLGRSSAQSQRYGAGQGYLSLEDELATLVAQGDERNSYLKRRERFLATQARYQEQVATLAREPVTFGDDEWVNAELLRVDDLELIRSIAAEVRTRGAEFVLVILPSQSGNRPFEQRLETELGSPVLRFNLPARYPELYAPENRFDSGHLSAAGARAFTRDLARGYVTWKEFDFPPCGNDPAATKLERAGPRVVQ